MRSCVVAAFFYANAVDAFHVNSFGRQPDFYRCGEASKKLPFCSVLQDFWLMLADTDPCCEVESPRGNQNLILIAGF